MSQKQSIHFSLKIIKTTTYHQNYQGLNYTIQFARIHTSSLIKIEKTLNRPIAKFYNSDDVNVTAAELRLTKTRSTSFNKKHSLL